MDNSLMRRYINAAVLFGTCQSKHVVILVDGAAYGAKAIVAVGQHIRDREFLKPRCSCCLDDTNVSDVMGSQFVKLDLQILHIAGCIMAL